jgi:hypothetical protein
MPDRPLILVAAAMLALVGCSESEPASDAALAPLLGGEIPDCLTLTAPAHREYRIAARRECLAQPSLDARLKSAGCLIQQEIGRCRTTREAKANGYGIEQVQAEQAAARR